MANVEEAMKAQKSLETAFSGKAGYNGSGIIKVDDGFAVKVNLESREAGLDIPIAINGVPVRVAVVGRIEKHGVS